MGLEQRLFSCIPTFDFLQGYPVQLNGEKPSRKPFEVFQEASRQADVDGTFYQGAVQLRIFAHLLGQPRAKVAALLSAPFQQELNAANAFIEETNWHPKGNGKVLRAQLAAYTLLRLIQQGNLKPEAEQRVLNSHEQMISGMQKNLREGISILGALRFVLEEFCDLSEKCGPSPVLPMPTRTPRLKRTNIGSGHNH